MVTTDIYRETGQWVVTAPPLARRLELVSAINPDVALTMDPRVTEILTIPMSDKDMADLVSYCGGEEQTYDQLALILTNPIVAQLVKDHRHPPDEIREEMAELKAGLPGTYQNAVASLAEDPLKTLQMCQLGMRPYSSHLFLNALTVVQRLYLKNDGIRQTTDQKGRTPQDLGLALIDQMKLYWTLGGTADPDLIEYYRQVLDKDSRDLDQVEFLAEPGEGELFNEASSLTLDILDKLSERQFLERLTPKQRDKLATDLVESFMDKLAMDYPAVNREIASKTRSLTVTLNAMLAACQHFSDSCFAIDDQATRKALLSYMQRTDLPYVYASDFWLTSDRRTFGDKPIGSDGRLSYFQDIEVQGLAPGRSYCFFELETGMLAIKVADTGEVVGIINAHPSVLPAGGETAELNILPLETGLGFFSRAGNVSPEKAQQFGREFQQFTGDKSLFYKALKESNNDCDPRQIQASAVFRIWEFLDSHPESQSDIYRFLKHYGSAGAMIFLLEEVAPGNLETLLEFSLKMAMRPKDLDRVKSMFTMYHLTCSYAPEAARNLASQMAVGREEENNLRDLINRRANKQLLGVLELYRQGRWHGLKKRIGVTAFRGYWSMLSRLVSPRNLDYAFPMDVDIPPDIWRKATAFQGGGLTALADSVLEAAQMKALNQEMGQAYAGHVVEITEGFYGPQVALMEKAVTGDTETEIQRNIGIFNRLIAGTPDDKGRICRLKPGASIVSIGCGDLQRVENKVVEAVEAHCAVHSLPPPFARKIGIDFIDYPGRPPGWQFIKGDMVDLAQDIPPGSLQCVWGVWSAPCDELEQSERFPMWKAFSDVLETFQEGGNSQGAIQEGGFLVIDLPFPYGTHSYEVEINRQHGEDPGLPRGVIKVACFDDPQHPEVPSWKYFYIFDPEEVIKGLRDAGFEIMNFSDSNWSSDPRKRREFYRRIKIERGNDESILKMGIDDPWLTPVWQTRERIGPDGEVIAPRNRFLVVARKVRAAKETENLVARVMTSPAAMASRSQRRTRAKPDQAS